MMPEGVWQFFSAGLFPGNFAHGVVEGPAEHLDKEVDGVAGEVALGPAPVGVLDDETGEGWQLEVADVTFDERELSVLEQRNQGRLPGRPDLFAGPARRRRVIRWGCQRWVQTVENSPSESSWSCSQV